MYVLSITILFFHFLSSLPNVWVMMMWSLFQGELKISFVWVNIDKTDSVLSKEYILAAPSLQMLLIHQ